jgi:hypothetical protein
VAPQGTPTARKLQATLRELLSEWPNLPGSADYEREVPPTAMCWVRPVRGTALVVCFNVGEQGVTILAVKIRDT